MADFVRGMIIPYCGKIEDLDLRNWAICDGTDGNAPNLTGLFLIGTAAWNEVKKVVGTATHSHPYDGVTKGTRAPGGSSDSHHGEEGGNPPQVTGDDHTHPYNGTTHEVTWTPPSMQVIYIMKK